MQPGDLVRIVTPITMDWLVGVRTGPVCSYESKLAKFTGYIVTVPSESEIDKEAKYFKTVTKDNSYIIINLPGPINVRGLSQFPVRPEWLELVLEGMF